MSVNRPPIDNSFPRYEANFFSIFEIIGSQVATPNEEQPIGKPRHLNGKVSFLQSKHFAAQLSQLSVTFMPIIELLKKIYL